MVAPGTGPTLEAFVRDELRAPVAELVRRLVVELACEELAHLIGHVTVAAPAAPAAQGTTNGLDATPAHRRLG